MTCDPPGLMPMSCNPATPTWCQLLCYIALHHWCPDLCQIGAQTRVRSVPRLVPPWCPDLCQIGAQTCVRSVPRLVPPWCPCPHGSLLIAGGMPPVPLSGLPALQCRAARQPAFLARGEPGSTVRKDISANTEPESKKSSQRTEVRPKSPEKASLGNNAIYQ